MRPLKHALAKIFICSRMLTALLYLKTLENSVHGVVLMLGSCNKILVYFGLYHQASVGSGTDSLLLLKV